MADPGRIVVVAAGFAVWRDGRCVAAARWADVRQVRARLKNADTTTIRVELTDGTVMELDDAAPGFDAFLDRAAAVFPKLLPFAAWDGPLRDGEAPAEGIVLYERPVPRRSRPAS